MAPKAHVFKAFVVGAIFLSLFSSAVNAEIIIHGTRVVYPAAARDVTLRMNNPGDKPMLVQAWIDDGDSSKAPEEMKVPFQLTPALSRLEANASAVLRIGYSKEPLPADRESLYWLNILEVPPQQKQGENRLAFTFRHRIKLFFRPADLKTNINSAAQKLSWKFEPEGVAKGMARGPLIQVSNPTPYYLSFSKVEVKVQGRTSTWGLGWLRPLLRRPLPGRPMPKRRHAMRLFTLRSSMTSVAAYRSKRTFSSCPVNSAVSWPWLAVKR